MIRSDLDNALIRLGERPSYSTYLAVANALATRGAGSASLRPLRMAILRNFTIEPLVPVLQGEMALAGLYPIVHLGGLETALQDAFDPDGTLDRFRPDLVIVALWLEALSPSLTERYASLSNEAARAEMDRVLDVLDAIATAIRRRHQAPILLNNFPLPLHPALGILDAQSERSQTQDILALNRELLRRRGSIPDVYLVDYMGLMARVGGAQAMDGRLWQIGRAPLGKGSLVPLGQQYGRFIRALRGKARKCLALDCDNTLWGGVIGEDGIGGLRIGDGYPGSCYRAFQRAILGLHDLGVILVLVSKNDESDVLEVLRNHPDMLLREEHFAAWVIGWEDKVAGLRRLSDVLGIGLDAFVFVDDSAFECGLVRRELPEVAVLQLGPDPSAFKDELYAAGYFDALCSSEEDRRRNAMYRADRRRRLLRAEAASLPEYLTSLEMEAEIGLADELAASRVSQLTQKTNQCNLTVRRYTEGQIRSFLLDPDVDVFILRLRDRVEDLGLVGVAIALYDRDEAEIDTFLLSCRALGRGAEAALLRHVIEAARARGCARVRGCYSAAPKNGRVAAFYSEYGFEPVADDGPATHWSLATRGELFEPPPWIKVRSLYGG